MNDQILNAIDEEIAKLRQVRAILMDGGKPSPGKTAAKAAAAKTKPRRILSAKARRAIAEAQRKRWAKVRSRKKAATPETKVRKEPAS